jgi:uncharacterized protein
MRDRLLAYIRQFESCAVAFSAGVDSTVVAKAAQVALGGKAVAVTAVSPSLADGELDEARRLAELIGIRHETIATGELDDANYTANAPDRCYFCKSELYSHLEQLAERFGVEIVFNGANIDDADDFRPGMRAAAEHKVKSPLAECGLTKPDVRALAADWDLPVWDKPATPCLSSRIAYGEEVTPERLRMIDRAEQFLRAAGLRTVRVRFHTNDMARLEVPLDSLPALVEAEFRDKLVAEFKQLGFKFVTLDLEGFRSGSQNVVLPIETLRRSTDSAVPRQN